MWIGIWRWIFKWAKVIKWNGKGKEYNNKGELIFEGEYKYGDKWNGKGYDGQNNLVYEIKNGKGKIIEYHVMVK